MNSLTLILGTIVWFVIGYFVYSKFLEGKLIKPNDKNKTPAQTHRNNIDYK